jgi:hypothetical protein
MKFQTNRAHIQCPASHFAPCPARHRDQKISIDNKSRFGYQDGYGGCLIGVSICWATSETDTQFTIFD